MSAITATSGNQIPSTSDAYQTLGTEDFYKLIFTELAHQDPLEPNDTSALLDQVSTIQAIQSDSKLAERLEDMVRQNEITTSSSLVGQFVSGKSSSGLDVAGYVDSVSITREGPILNLSSGYPVALDDLIEVIDPQLFDGAGGNLPPLVANAVPDQVATRGAGFTFTIPRDTFSDEESIDSLSMAITQDDGSPLPDWLAFNPTNRQLAGTPGPDDASPLNIRVTAIDSFNQRVSTTFSLTLVNGSEP